MLEHRAEILLPYQRRRFPQRPEPAWRTPRRPPRRRSRRTLPSAPAAPARPADRQPPRPATCRYPQPRRTRAARGRPHATAGTPLVGAYPAARGRAARAWGWSKPPPSWGREQHRAEKPTGARDDESARAAAAGGDIGREAGAGAGTRATRRGGGHLAADQPAVGRPGGAVRVSGSDSATLHPWY